MFGLTRPWFLQSGYQMSNTISYTIGSSQFGSGLFPAFPDAKHDDSVKRRQGGCLFPGQRATARSVIGALIILRTYRLPRFLRRLSNDPADTMDKGRHHRCSGERPPIADADVARSGVIAPSDGVKGYRPVVEVLGKWLGGASSAFGIRGGLNDSLDREAVDRSLLADPAMAAAAWRLSGKLKFLRNPSPMSPSRPSDGMRWRLAALRDGIDLPDALLDRLHGLRAA